jgi:zinc/manganese transport system substrate-binding protein/manganese/iron transport system substrate-binding protein
MRRLVAVLALAFFAGYGCADDGSGAASGKMLKVVATTTQLTDFALVVGAGRVDVYSVLRAGVDAHDFEPSPADIEAIRDADVVIQNGVGLEEWFDDTIDSAGPQGEVVDASEGARIRSDENPHIWFDPRNAKVMVANVADALVAADPPGTSVYRANLRAYDEELDRLDVEIAAQVEGLTNKKFVSNHDAFAYYVDRYGLEFVGSVIPSFDTQAELSSRDISDLVAKIEREGVKAVFSESSLPPKTAAAVAAEAGVTIVDGEDALFGDALGPPGSEGDSYLKMQRHNTKVIIENLG